MFYKRQDKNYIAFEELHIRHLNLLMDLNNKEFNNWFYKMAIINTFEDFKKFLINLEKNKNKCIISIQNNQVIGFIHTYPINVNKTCLKIDEPKICDNNYSSSNRELLLELIKKTISIKDLKLSNWIISSDINNNELISVSRELGFQPLKETKLWKTKESKKSQSNQKEDFLFLTTNFERIDQNNIKSILNFLRSNESILIRNLLDYIQKDIEKRNYKYSGCIRANGEIILTILRDLNYKDKNVYSIISGICWDERLNNNLKNIIINILRIDSNVIFKTYAENINLNKLLNELGLKEYKNELLLVKNSLIKRQSKNINTANNSLDSILDKLNPSGSPFPSPMPTNSK